MSQPGPGPEDGGGKTGDIGARRGARSGSAVVTGVSRRQGAALAGTGTAVRANFQNRSLLDK